MPALIDLLGSEEETDRGAAALEAALEDDPAVRRFAEEALVPVSRAA